MFQRLWTTLPFVSWEGTIRFHVHLFRCLVLGFLDAHTELAFLSRSSERLLAILDQRLAHMGLTHDAGHVHDPVSHRASPGGRDDDATIRWCHPKWRYEATPFPSFALNVPMEPFVGVVPPFLSQPINVSHGLYYDESAAAFWGYSGLLVGVVGCILLWMLTLVFVIWRSSITPRTRSPRDMYRPLRAAKSKTPNSVGPSAEDVRGLVFAPGPWIIERQVQSAMKTLQEFIRGEIQTPWTLFSQSGAKAWTRILDLAANLPSTYGSNDAIILERNHGDGRSLVCQKLGSSKVGSHSGISTLAILAGNERLEPAANRLASESSFFTGNVCGSTTAVHDPFYLPSAINEVAVGPIPAQVTAPDKVCEDTSSWRNIGSVVDAAKVNLNLNTTLFPDGDDSASEFGSASSRDEGSLGVGTQRDMSPSEGKDRYSALGDGASSGLGSPLLLRRARTVGHLWRKCDRFDDHEGTGDDSYWTEQVYARLSGEFHLARCRYGRSDASSWPREGREDESDSWRTRSSQIVAESVGPEETHDVQTNDNKLRRYSSPCLNVNASLSQRTESGDGPQETYVIPQKRGRATGGRCWSPASSPRLSDHPSGLGFLPFRKTPTLLTPTAWKPGCLYVPDPPADELRQAAAWWDRCDTGSTAGHMSVFRDRPINEPAVLFTRDRPPEGPVSWRDRYENDPASRRFVSVHRRAVTDG